MAPCMWVHYEICRRFRTGFLGCVEEYQEGAVLGLCGLSVGACGGVRYCDTLGGCCRV